MLRVENLRRFLSDIGNNVRYYRDLFAERGFDPSRVASLDDLGTLPVLTKADGTQVQPTESTHSVAYKPDNPNTRTSSGLNSFALGQVLQFLPYALAVAAASFLYVAVADLIPGLHRRVQPVQSLQQVALIAVGIAVIVLAD